MTNRPSGSILGKPSRWPMRPMPTLRRSRFESVGTYPPSTRPVIRSVDPHGTILGVILILILAGTIVVACPLAGSTTADPAYTARISLDGPGGSVAVQLPSWSVLTDIASVKAFEPSAGAVRIAIG